MIYERHQKALRHRLFFFGHLDRFSRTLYCFLKDEETARAILDKGCGESLRRVRKKKKKSADPPDRPVKKKVKKGLKRRGDLVKPDQSWRNFSCTC